MQTLTDMALVILQDELTITETSAENEAKPKQGPRSNFEIWGGGGGGISDSILGGTRQFFLLNLYNFKNIGGARAPPAHPPPPPAPLLRGPCHSVWGLQYGGFCSISRDASDSSVLNVIFIC